MSVCERADVPFCLCLVYKVNCRFLTRSDLSVGPVHDDQHMAAYKQLDVNPCFICADGTAGDTGSDQGTSCSASTAGADAAAAGRSVIFAKT